MYHLCASISSARLLICEQESRHAFGMRALGLPNTKHFHEITRIEDALSRLLIFYLQSGGVLTCVSSRREVKARGPSRDL